MADIVILNGISYIIPIPGEEDWGQNVTDFLIAIPPAVLQKTGGLFTLTADANVGPTFGLISPYYKSTSINLADAGAIRLAKTDLIEWRNNTNGGNNTLGTNSSNQLIYNGSPLEFNALTNAHIFVGNVSNVATDVAMTGDIGITNAGVTSIQPGVIVNSEISNSAAIAYGKLALTGSIVNADIYSGAAIAFNKLASLTSAHLLVGSAGNAATDTALSGDATLSNTGVLTLANTAVSSASYTLTNLTVDSKGRLTAASSTATGNLTDAGTDGITITGGTNAVIGSGTTISQHVADATHNGYLSSTDWNTFNSKEAATLTNTHIYVGNASNVATDVPLSGDATLANTGALTLNTVNSNVGSFTYTNITVNAKGLVTAASSGTFGNLTDAGTDGITVTGGTGAVAGSGTSLSQHVADSTHNGYLSSTDWSTFNGKQAAGNYITALTGDITATGPGSVAATLATVNSNVGTFAYSTITVNAKGLITAASANTPVTSLTGTTNEIIVSSSTGAVTLSTPQAIATSSTPTFASETLTATTNQLILGTTRTVTISATQPATSSRVYTIPDQGAAANFLLDQANYTISGTWTFSNDTTLASSKKLILTDNTTNTVGIKATNSTTSYTLSLPTTAGSSLQFLQTDGSGNTTWASPAGSGTVNSGTATHLSYYATSTTAVSDASGNTISGSYTFSGGAGAITMSSSTIAMGANKITGLANGTASTDAMAYGQNHIVQIVNGNYATTTSTTSGSDQTSNLTASITPTSSSNKVRVRVTMPVSVGVTPNYINVTLYRGGSAITATATTLGSGAAAASSGYFATFALEYYDSPATTSATSYTIKFNSNNATNSVSCFPNSSIGNIWLEEIQ